LTQSLSSLSQVVDNDPRMHDDDNERRLQENHGPFFRRGIEALLGTPVYLDLRVKVAKDWQRDPRQLRRLGF
jgi:hypothetical protein